MAVSRRFSLVAITGKSDPPNAAFLSSLDGNASFKAANNGWFQEALPSTEYDVVGSAIHVRVRVLIYLFVPIIKLAPTVDTGSALIFPLPRPLASLVHKLNNAGLPSSFPGLRECRDAVIRVAALIPASERTFDASDVHTVAVTSTSLEGVSPLMLRAADDDNAMLSWLLVLLPGYYKGVASGLMPSALALLRPASVDAADPTPLVAVKVATAFRESQFEPPFDYYMPFGAIISELMRRRRATEEERFAPLFDEHWQTVYPVLHQAFPSVTASVLMKRAVQTLAASCGVQFSLTPPSLDGMCMRLSTLLAQLEGEAPAATSSTEDRLRVLSTLYSKAARPAAAGGHTVSSEPKELDERDERFDKLLADADYKSLYHAVVALNTSSFSAADAALMVCRHKHPAGLIMLATSRNLPQSAWASVIGFRQKTAWQAMFDRALAIDRFGTKRHDWGNLLPMTAETPAVAIQLVTGKLDKIADWWTLLLPWATRYRGPHVVTMLRYAATADPMDFWLSEDRLRLAEPALHAIFDTIGHGDSRSIEGSFREWLHYQLDRATQVAHLPTGSVAQGAIVADVKRAVALTFSAFSEGVATMFLRPFHEAKRQAFCHPSSIAAKAFDQIDKDITTTQAQLELAEKGQAAHQLAHLQPVGPLIAPPLLRHVPLGSVGGSSTSSGAGPSSGSATLSLTGSTVPSLVGSPPPQSSPYPVGVYKGWGSAAAALGVWKCPEGLAFGKTIVSLQKPSITFPPGTCLAAAAHNVTAINRSKWCVSPAVCKALGYAAHDRVDGTVNDDYTSREFDPATTDTSSWQPIIQANPALLGVAAPRPPWPMEGGPTGSHSFNRDKRSADDAHEGARGRGRHKRGGKGDGRGRGGRKKVNFERLSTGCKPSESRYVPPLAFGARNAIRPH